MVTFSGSVISAVICLVKKTAQTILVALLLAFSVCVYVLTIYKSERISVGMMHDEIAQVLDRLGANEYELAGLASPGARPRITQGVTGTGFYRIDQANIVLGLFYDNDELKTIELWYLDRVANQRFHPSQKPHEKLSAIGFPRVRYLFNRSKLPDTGQ